MGSSLAIGSRAGPADYAASIRGLLTGQTIDAVMAYYVDVGGGDPQSVLAAISEVAATQNKPVVASVLGSSDRRRVERQGDSVPNFRLPRDLRGRPGARGRAAGLSFPRALGERPQFDGIDAEAARARVAAWLDDHPTVDTQQAARGWLPTAQSAALLATHGIPVRGRRALPGHSSGPYRRRLPSADRSS